MMGFISLTILTTCLCLGIRCISDIDKLFSPLKDYLGKKLPVWIWKPVIGCVTCMPSFYGTIVFWWVFIFTDVVFSVWTLPEWFLVCLTASFICDILWTFNIWLREGTQ